MKEKPAIAGGLNVRHKTLGALAFFFLVLSACIRTATLLGLIFSLLFVAGTQFFVLLRVEFRPVFTLLPFTAVAHLDFFRQTLHFPPARI